MQNLVIIESPGKIGAISSSLGKGYKVIASVGHVRDLPVSTIGVDIKNGYTPKYITIKGKSTIINQLKREIKKSDKIYLATDPDREGEAISWHLVQVLGLDENQAYRVTFNEITKNAILQGIDNPRQIDMNLVNSQQARRILDRLVGYELSPYLWKTVKRGLSAGRVQSVVTKIIVERDEQIKNFQKEEYWTITCTLDYGKKGLNVHYFGEKGKEKAIKDENSAKSICSDVDGETFVLTKHTNQTKQKAPYPPYITSSFQQDLSKKLGYPTKRIMKIAQELYEGVSVGDDNHGLITYMRTDSLRISKEASEMAKQFICNNYGNEYYPKKSRVYKTKGNAQDAHEAIRPTNVFLTPEKVKAYLTKEQFAVYDLIWRRFVASQMENCEILNSQFEFDSHGHTFRSNESKVLKDGYLLVYNDEDVVRSKTLTNLNEGDELKCLNVDPKQNFTSPPPHYTEGTLIKVMDEKGIGRPSTYSSTIQTIIERGYVKREKKELVATELGYSTVNIMNKNFPKYMDYKFTANMENELDNIASGEESMVKVLDDFYLDFSKTLDSANKKIGEDKLEYQPEEAGFVCEKCGKPMYIKKSKYGFFAGCSGYPECNNIVSLDKNKKPIQKKQEDVAEETSEICPDCGGKLVIRSGITGKFYACANYPKCKYTRTIPKYIGVKCPKCGKEVVEHKTKKGILYYSCEDYPKCDFSQYKKPEAK